MQPVSERRQQLEKLILDTAKQSPSKISLAHVWVTKPVLDTIQENNANYFWILAMIGVYFAR